MSGAKVVLVTGSSSGFGNLIVKTLARAGHLVVATMRGVRGRNVEAARALEQWASSEQGARIRVTDLDVTSEASVRDAVASVVEVEGRIDVAVNNAGLATMGQVEAFTDEQLRLAFEVNVFGPNRVIRAVLPHMRARRTGLLIQISSEAAALPIPFHGAYPASKVAVEYLAESYRDELAPLGIDSVIVEPGGFPTSLVDNALRPGDAARLEGYGSLAELPEKLFAGAASSFTGPNAPSPQKVADAVLRLVETPPGQRPLKTVVDEMGFALVTEGIVSINANAARVKREVLAAMGLRDAVTLVPGAWE